MLMQRRGCYGTHI